MRGAARFPYRRRFRTGKLSGVQGAVWIQDADHNPSAPSSRKMAISFIEFIALVVAEAVIAVPRAQQRPDLQVRIFPDLAEQRHRRGYAADDQVAAEFYLGPRRLPGRQWRIPTQSTQVSRI